ncbi:fungal-specific transcription factor domain-containing protein [Multifurca ochricompacta]|uniref:Fungal-specific transcription factor domain-containing protein n=1 Tax=Multifurca ochricompacta TaxID=376703 RepID=A0AAD4QJZ7_9AGAM|nr:fungal-specific transcription factor domain-containing protein [Multifurca ochricompacta]
MPESEPSSNQSHPSPNSVGKKHPASSEGPSTNIRPRSPTYLDTSSTADGARIPTKRARKAINCGPCRLSKLKCDRERPCSSCKLRGTTASCYQGSDGRSPATIRGDDPNDPRSVNTAIEFSKIRQALTLIEAHVNYIQRSPASSGAILARQPSFDVSITLPPIKTPPLPQLKQDNAKLGLSEPEAAPGARGQSDWCGFYAGPTSAVSHLTPDVKDGASASDGLTIFLEPTLDVHPDNDSDYDLRKELPHASVIDGLVDFYFEYCNWVYRHVNHRAFMTAWARYKSGARADRIVLATVCMIMAVTLHYLPAGHELLRALPSDVEELGTRFYNVMRLAFQRKQSESRAYTLELVELLLVRCHYLTFSKIDSEEIWHVKGELVTIATAMGLHRDPGRANMLSEVAERRRWAWWHIILFERWQAFMFGRPIAIASHHFDTRLPSYCDPEVDSSGKLYEANIHLFRLAFILGNIMDDAVSLRPVAYESILAQDRVLQGWWDALPTELDMDDYALVGCLASPTTSKRRIGVQSVIVRTAFLHIRFTLHRPYASLAHSETSKYSPSLEISVNAADKLIALSAHARPEMLNHAALAVPGHMNWGPLHCFSAAIFFCFQIINNPEQAGARLFRVNVIRAVTTLESCRGMPVAEKALDILRALGPLYTEAFLSDSPDTRENKKQVVLPAVRRLQFPYHDSPNVPIGISEVAANGTPSPAQSSANTESPRPGATQENANIQAVLHEQQAEVLSMLPPVAPVPMLQPHSQHVSHQQQHHTYENLPSLKWPPGNSAFSHAQYLGQQQSHPSLVPYQDVLPGAPEEAVWQLHHTQHDHAPATMLPPDPTSPERSFYVTQMNQDAYHQGEDVAVAMGVQMGLGGTEGVLWGANSGFVQGEWDRMYTGLGRAPFRGLPLEG